MSKNIFRAFVLARPVKTPLDFGYNDNIVIEGINFGDKKKNGIRIQLNTFIRLTKLKSEDKSVLASTEVSFWDLDPTKDFVYDNFISQFSILCGVIDAIGGDVEAYENAVLDVVEGDDSMETTSFLKKPANCKAAQQILIDGFKEQANGKTGLNSTLLKCKLVVNKGGFVQPANDIMWMLPMDSELSLPNITSREKAVYAKSLKTERKAKPDTTGSAPGTTTPSSEKSEEKKVSSNSLDSI